MKYHIISKFPPTPSEELIINQLSESNHTFEPYPETADVIIIGDSVKARLQIISKEKTSVEHFTNGQNFIAREFFS